MVFDGTPEEYERRHRKGIAAFRTRILAVWEVPYNDSDWIDRLVQEGLADRLFQHSFHSRYATCAFFVNRLDFWKDISLHWERRQAHRKAWASVALASENRLSNMPERSTWLTVNYFDSKRLKQRPSEAILTVDRLDMALFADRL
jgi:hypothetical protein